MRNKLERIYCKNGAVYCISNSVPFKFGLHWFWFDTLIFNLKAFKYFKMLWNWIRQGLKIGRNI